MKRAFLGSRCRTIVRESMKVLASCQATSARLRPIESLFVNKIPLPSAPVTAFRFGNPAHLTSASFFHRNSSVRARRFIVQLVELHDRRRQLFRSSRDVHFRVAETDSMALDLNAADGS